MEQDEDPDILGVKPWAKAVEKITDKSVDGIGSFFHAICMPAAEELGLLLRDKVAVYRKRNLEAIIKFAQEKISHQKIQATGEANPYLLREVIEEASWSEDPSIQSMWAGLLAVASGQRGADDDSVFYTDTLKRLTPFQACLINHIYSDPRCCSVRPPIESPGPYLNVKNNTNYSYADILKLYPGDLSKFVPIANQTHKQIIETVENQETAISRLRPQFEQLVTLGLLYAVEFIKITKTSKGISVLPAIKGLDFYMRCLGYNVYPLEKFLLTLQEECKLKGIDPFTYKTT